MKLSDLLNDIAHVERDLAFAGLALDSRKVAPGDVFIALNGSEQHGLRHAQQACDRGAVAIIYDPSGEGEAQAKSLSANCIAVAGLSRQLGRLAARFYGDPSRQTDVIGITGTNGKTSCSQLLAQALPACGIIGTLGWGVWGSLNNTANTTPDALTLQSILRQLVAQDKHQIAIEVSSHGLQQGRVDGICFKGAVFTNLSRDHLDYHGNMDDYLQAKLGLFTMPDLRFVVVNLDDPRSSDVLAVLAEDIKRWGFSANGNTRTGINCVTASDVRFDAQGIHFTAHWQHHCLNAHSVLVGGFNLDNLLAVLTTLLAMEMPFTDAVAKLATLQPIPGRMEKIGGNDKPLVVIDYAHSPDALEKALQALQCNGQLHLVFGCGGNRDQGKRAAMGRIASELADRVIVTDDNPRHEQPEVIVADIVSGCDPDKLIVIHDRKTAIDSAIASARIDDCVLIAGKGHEDYQEIAGHKYPFSDLIVAQQALSQWGRA